MHYPHPRVVCAEGDGDVPAKWEESDVAARWVLVSEDGRVARVGERIVRPVLLGEQEEIVAVEVDWVGERDEGAVWEEVGRVAWLAFNYQVDPGVGGVVGEDEGGLGCEGGVFEVVDGGVGEVEVHGVVCQGPAEEGVVRDGVVVALPEGGAVVVDFVDCMGVSKSMGMIGWLGEGDRVRRCESQGLNKRYSQSLTAFPTVLLTMGTRLAYGSSLQVVLKE